MSIFFTSDLHFYHKNIINFCNRPYVDVDEMNEKIVEGWNAVVKPNDDVYSLGDFSFAPQADKAIAILQRLNGKHTMILGNHDHVISKNRERIVAETNVVAIYERRVITVNKQKIVLDHYPGRSWNYSSHGGWQLHGHVHGVMEPYGKSVDVGFDSPWITGQAEHRLFTYEELEAFMATRETPDEFKGE